MAAIDTKVRVLTATASTSDSEVDMTSSGAGDAAWYILFITGDYTDGNSDTGAAKVSIGFGAIESDTTVSDASFGCTVQTSQDPTNSAQRGATLKSGMIMSDDGTFLSDYIDFKTRITDGITFEFNGGGNAGTTYRLCAIVGFGDGWQADVGEFIGDATEDTEKTETLKAAFTDTPEALFIAGSDERLDNTIRTDFHCALGWTIFDVESGTDDYEQCCTSFSVADNIAAPGGNARLISAAGISGDGTWAGDRIYTRARSAGATTAELEVTGVGAGEFSLTTREDSVAVPVMYLALSSGGVVDMSYSVWSMSGSTGDVDFTGVTWIPQAYMGIFGLIQTADVDGTEASGNPSRTQTYSAADKNGDEFSCGWRIRNNAGSPLNTSYGDSTSVVGTRNHNNNLTHEGKHSSMNVDGFTINVTDGVTLNPATPVFLWSEPTVTLTPTGLDAGLAFGLPRPSLVIDRAGGFDAGVAIGSPDLSLLLEPAGLDGNVAFGLPTLAEIVGAETITPTGLAVTVAFGGPSLLVRVLPDGLDANVALGGVSLAARLLPDGLDADVAFGGPSLAARLLPDGLDAGLGFGQVTPSLLLELTGFDAGVTLGAVELAARLLPDGLDATLAFGGPSLAARLFPDGLDANLVFGSPSLALRLFPDGLDSNVVFGLPTVAVPTDTETITPTGLSVPLAFGGPSLRIRLSPDGLAVPPAFGAPSLALRLALTGLGVDVGLGEPVLALRQPMAPEGLDMGLAFGAPSLALLLAPTGLAVAPAFGNPALKLTIGPTGLAVEVAFGPPSISGPLVIAPSPAFNVVQSGAVAGIVSQSGMVQANAVQSGMAAAQVSQSGMVAGQVTQSGLVAGGVA